MPTNWRLGLSYSLITTVLWGLLPIALKGLLEQMDAMTITWYRFLASTLVGFLWYGHRNLPELRLLLSRRYRLLLLLASFGLLSNYIFYLLGLEYITASAAQIIIQLAPLLLLLGSVILFKEAFSRWQGLGVLGFCIGMVLFFHHRFADFSDAYLIGLLLIIAGSVTWAGYGLAHKQLLKTAGSNNILLLLYFSGAIAFWPVAQPQQLLQLDGAGLSLLAFAALNTLIAYGAFGLAMTHWEGSRVSAVVTMAPLVTLAFVELLAVWSPGYTEVEPLDLLSWFGALLVVLGSIAAALGKSSAPKLDSN